MQRVIAAIFFLFVLNCSYSQLNFSLTAGATAGSLRENSSRTNCTIGCDKGAVPGYWTGVGAGIPIWGPFAIRSGLNYVKKGGKYRLNHIDNGANRSVTAISYYTTILQFVELPVGIFFQKEAEGGFFCGAGPVVSLGIKGKRGEKLHTAQAQGAPVQSQNPVKIVFKAPGPSGGPDVYLKPVELGLGFYAGYALFSGVFCQLQYRPGLTNLLPDRTKGTYKSRYWGLGLGYNFKTNKKQTI